MYSQFQRYNTFVYYFSNIRILLNSDPDLTEIVHKTAVSPKLWVQFFVLDFFWTHVCWPFHNYLKTNLRRWWEVFPRIVSRWIKGGAGSRQNLPAHCFQFDSLRLVIPLWNFIQEMGGHLWSFSYYLTCVFSSSLSKSFCNFTNCPLEKNHW